MKVQELVKFLKTQDKNAEVLLSSDGEGNAYSPCNIEHYGYATGDFDKEKGSIVDIRNSIYSMDEDEMKGPYIILYPR